MWNEACNLAQNLGNDRKDTLDKTLEAYISKVSAMQLDAAKKDGDNGNRKYALVSQAVNKSSAKRVKTTHINNVWCSCEKIKDNLYE